ncbi:YciK family oxidoreductase [Pseudomaricurvus sp. HS19]|uniref:YciK family oxidoreductase n=1 Tax=Pseudomaricurvus sp. HS19 TaxID=2692626 RepID=UPI00136F8B15|nr:YciK family oxidoreductase [Pseudomaricurvus sp. HS19]MYM62891.1 YciK family oxidoreductase [Pseudomaricurvus sp. HS19]
MKQLPSDFQAAQDCLKDRVIIVTGAGDGIGRTAAITFAAHGATVVLVGRTIQKLEMVYDEIEAAGHPQPAIYPINLEGASAKDYEDMAQALFDEFGKLDGLLHNAADLGERTPISNYAPDTWLRVMQVNVNAPFMMSRALLPLLEKSDSGSILFTGSSVGYEGRAFWGAYAASKAAAENLMQTLAQELEGTTRIRANSVNPGATRTRMRAAAYPAENPQSVKAPDDLMPLYLYLLSDASVGVSGEQFSS